MFSEQSLKLIAMMIDGVQLKPTAQDFAIMAQAFEMLKQELKVATTQTKDKGSKKEAGKKE